MLRYALLVIIGIGFMGAGVWLGRTSVDSSVPLLPTRVVATPQNYLAQMEATRAPYGFEDGTPTPMSPLEGDLARGEALYQQCAHCHGLRGAGEPGSPNPNIPDAYGFMPVPRHDSYGHTWLHPDQLLLAIIRDGSQNPLYRQLMPAYGQVLSDEEIMLVIEYMKLWWTDEQRAQQAAATERLRLAREE